MIGLAKTVKTKKIHQNLGSTSTQLTADAVIYTNEHILVIYLFLVICALSHFPKVLVKEDILVINLFIVISIPISSPQVVI